MRQGFGSSAAIRFPGAKSSLVADKLIRFRGNNTVLEPSLRRLLSITFILSMLAGITPLVAISSASQSPGKTVNLLLIVDSSGSMAAPTDTGVIRMDAAKGVLTQVISEIPDVDNVNVGLRVYGHKGDNTDLGRPESCVSSELVVPMDGVDAQKLTDQVNVLQPVGWTPLGYSLQEASKDFTQPASDQVVNSIVMVTDGLETCDANPIAIAGELRNSTAGIVTHVIGFGTTPEEQAILSGVAEAGEGQLLGSNNAGQLMSALFEVLEDLEVVEETGSGESRESPLGIGRAGTVGDYEVSVISVATDATSLMNPNAGPPAAGYQYFGARLSITYVGPTSGTAGYDLVFRSVGASSRSYTYFTDICGPANYPDTIFYAGELFTGGTGEYVVCWQIEAADADSLVMYVDTSEAQPERLWLSLGNPIEQPVEPETAAPSTAESPEKPEPTVQTEQTASSASGGNPSIVVDDDGFDPQEITVQADIHSGFTVTNRGTASCSFVLEELVPLQLGTFPPGTVTTIEMTFISGRHSFYCSGPTDTGSGEIGILNVI